MIKAVCDIVCGDIVHTSDGRQRMVTSVDKQQMPVEKCFSPLGYYSLFRITCDDYVVGDYVNKGWKFGDALVSVSG